MLRLLTLASLLIPAAALADAPAKAPPKPLAAGDDPCKTLNTTNGKCDKSATLKSKAVGTATLYKVAGDTNAFAFVVEKDGERYMSPPFEMMTSNCGAGRCDNLDGATPKLREIKLGEAPAVALELTLRMSHTQNEGKAAPVKWTQQTFVVCGKAGKSWGCLTTSFGSRDIPCTATLSATGELKHTCTETTQLAL